MRKNISGISTLLGIGVIFLLIANLLIPDLFTRTYVSIQIVIGITVFGVLWWQRGWYGYTNTAASIVTVIGVFGTFLGIFIGLLPFDTENIKGSIPPLIEGLKLAFLTSLVGICSAIILKAYALVYQMIKGKDPAEETITQLFCQQTTELLKPLTALLKLQTEESRRTQDALNSIKASLADDHQSTVFTQLLDLATQQNQLIDSQKIGQDQIVKSLDSLKASLLEGPDAISPQLQVLTNSLSENHIEVINEFRKFAEKVVTVSTDKLVEALEEVVHKFNEKINEQFGENFKRLNEAVQEINVWQEQYRQQMDELANEFRIAAQSVEQSRVALASAAQSLMTIEDQSESLVAVAQKLDPLLGTLNSQLEAFGRLGQQADEAFPRIEEGLNSLTEGFVSALTTIEDRSKNFVSITEKLDPLLGTLNSQLEAFGRLGQQADEAFPRIEEGLNSLTEGFASALTIIENRSKSLVSIAEKLDPILNTLNNQLEVFDDLSQRTDEVFPRIEEGLNNLTEKFSSVVEQAINNSYESIEKQREALTVHIDSLQATVQNASEEFTHMTTTFSESVEAATDRSYTSMDEQRNALTSQLQQLQTTINTVLEKIDQQLTEASTDFSASIDAAVSQSQVSMNQQREALINLTKDLRGQLENVIKTTNNELDTTLRRSTQHIVNQVEKLDEELGKELRKSLTMLGSQLASLSEKFVEDYEPLTERLREIVTIAGNPSLQIPGDNP